MYNMRIVNLSYPNSIMKRLIRVLSTNLPSLNDSYDAVFYASGCPGGPHCICAPYDHDDEDVKTFGPAGSVSAWLKENDFLIVYEDERMLCLGHLTDLQQLAFKLRWDV